MSGQLPVGEAHEPTPVFTFGQLRHTGVLWLVNRVVFHPRGFALALEYEQKGAAEPGGWSLVGDGTEPWYFAPDNGEDQAFTSIEQLLELARSGRAPRDRGDLDLFRGEGSR